MSSDHCLSSAGSTGSSIPLGAEAVRYNASHSQRPSSSRKLFVNNNEDTRNHSELGAVSNHSEHAEENSADAVSERSKSAGNVTAKSDRLSSDMGKMLSKLKEDMERVCRIYGDGSFFAPSPISFEAELIELSKLSEQDAREQLERYALRCHVSEREKEQLHRRNNELSDAVEILRTQVVRGQCSVVEQMRHIANQAIDALRSLEQSSSAEITKWKQKHALSLAQSNTIQNQLRHTATQLEAKKEEAKEANKHLDMLRFERDSLRNHKDQVEQQLDQADSGIRDLITQLKKKDEILEAKQKDIEAKEIEIRELKERLKRVEAAADAHVKKREEEITKQMDNYLQETRLIDAERERHTKMRVLEAQQRLKLVQDERDAALKRAQAAEEKVADYEENFMQYRGQMEGEALRAITNGYRNALSAIPSSRRSKCSSIDPLFPLTRLSAYSENEPPADPCGKPFNVRSARVRVPSRSETSGRSEEPHPGRKK